MNLLNYSISMVVCGITALVPAASCMAYEFIEHKAVKLDVDVGVGRRSSELLWNIGYDDSTVGPNVLSELTYKRIDVDETAVDARLFIKLRDEVGVVFSGLSRRADISEGNNEDSDYYFDDREGEFSRSVSDISGDDMRHDEYSVGLRKYLPASKSIDVSYVTLFVGSMSSEQNLRSQNGVQVLLRGLTSEDDLVDIPSALGPFDDLNSTYQTEWEGHTLGARIVNEIGAWHITWTGTYYDLSFDAQADWNLRDDFAHPVSFTHKADGRGFGLRLRVDYAVMSFVNVFYEFDCTRWRVNDGIDVTFFSDGTFGTIPLQEAEWETSAHRVGLGFRF